MMNVNGKYLLTIIKCVDIKHIVIMFYIHKYIMLHFDLCILTLITVIRLKAREAGSKIEIDTIFPCQSTILRLVPLKSTKGRIP